MTTEPDTHEEGEWHRAGLARAFFIFVVGLGAAGVLIGVLNGPFDAVMATGDTLGQSQQAQTGQGDRGHTRAVTTGTDRARVC